MAKQLNKTCRICGKKLMWGHRRQKTYCSKECQYIGYKGRKMSDKQKTAISKAQKGKKLSAEHIENLKRACKGRLSPMEGKKHTGESRAKMSKQRRGKPQLHRQGENSNFWQGGITPQDAKLRSSMEYSSWRMQVYERDDFTCQSCGDSQGRNLEAHHILGFTKYPKMRFVVENGVTLCQKCHRKLHYKQKAG